MAASGTELSGMQVSAMSCMVVSQLPFPPMPLCVLVGSENSDGMCSSHDLMASAIAVKCHDNLLKAPHLHSNVDNETLLKKTAILHGLQQRIESICDVEGFGGASLAMCYHEFQDSFRQYMQLYPSTSTDLRFHPMESVDTTSTICKQAREHLRVKSLIDNFDTDICADSYPDLIRLYCKYLHGINGHVEGGCKSSQ